jgi:hypothetical protein
MNKPADVSIVIKMVIKLGLDYVRWTQFVPMILGWAFALMMIAGMLLVAFQGGIETLLERMEPMVENVLGPAPEAAAGSDASEETTSIHVTEDDIVPWVMRIWGGLALAGWMISMIREHLYGPRPVRTLRQKLKIAGYAAGGFASVMLIVNVLIGDFSGNTPAQLMVPFIFLPLGLWVVSAWSLTISYVIDRLQKVVDQFGNTGDTDEPTHTTAA